MTTQRINELKKLAAEYKAAGCMSDAEDLWSIIHCAERMQERNN